MFPCGRLMIGVGLLLCPLGTLSPADEAPAKIKAEVLLRGGTVHDGSGQPGRVADVAIAKDKILDIGDLSKNVSADWVIDCSGLIVCPGFIDLHNHSDKEILRNETRANLNFILQGCTTIVTGNCGAGPYDAGEFYDEIDRLGAGTNVAHLLPQGGLRQEVMGTALRKPTDTELNRMLELADQAMLDGVWGMSTGLIYVPSSYADTDELVEIAKVVGKHGGVYASHIRGEGTELLQAVGEAIEIGRRAGVPVHISHFKSSGQESWGLVREAARRIATARDEGLAVSADQYPYHASSTSLDATLLPTWTLEGGREELLKRLDDAAQGPRIRSLVEKSLERKSNGEVLRIARFAPRQDWIGKNLVEIARAEGKTPLEIAYEIFRSGGAQIVHFSMSEDDVRHVMAIDWVATASDGRAFLPGPDKPHPRSYGTFSRKIGYYALQHRIISLEHAIRSATGLPALILGLTDRGTLKAGAFADVVVFSSQEVQDAATFDEPHQYARGMKYVFVNGRPAVVNGAATGALFGRGLRRKSPLATERTSP